MASSQNESVRPHTQQETHASQPDEVEGLHSIITDTFQSPHAVHEGEKEHSVEMISAATTGQVSPCLCVCVCVGVCVCVCVSKYPIHTCMLQILPNLRCDLDTRDYSCNILTLLRQTNFPVCGTLKDF